MTDNYEFVSVFDKKKLEFDVAGTRHCKDIEECKHILAINDRLFLEPESKNANNENAIKVICVKNSKKYHIGYVPRYYSKQLTQLLSQNIKYSALIQGLNFETAINDENINASVKLIFNV